MKRVIVNVSYPDRTRQYYHVCFDSDVAGIVERSHRELPRDGVLTGITIDDVKHTVHVKEKCITRGGETVRITGIAHDMVYGYRVRATTNRTYGDMLRWWADGTKYTLNRKDKSALDLVKSIDRGITFDIM